MKKPFIFTYTKIGETCLVEEKMMKRLFSALESLGVESKDVPPNPASGRRIAGVSKSKSKHPTATRG
mgnify:CR=1 FL=1